MALKIVLGATLSMALLGCGMYYFAPSQFIIFITHPISLSAIAWLILPVTIGGFAIALQQIGRLSTITEAVATAVDSATRSIRRLDGLAEVNNAIAQLQSARTHLLAKNWNVTAIYLDVARRSLVIYRELASSAEESSDIGRLIVQLSLIETQAIDAGKGKNISRIEKAGLEFSSIFDQLHAVAARLRNQPQSTWGVS